MLIVPVSLWVAGTGRAGDAGPSIKNHLLFILPVALGQIAVQLLMQSDIMTLGHFASTLVVAQGMAGDEATKAASALSKSMQYSGNSVS